MSLSTSSNTASLGLRFSELYVRGFLSGGRYDRIPLEVSAYALGRRFEGNPSAAILRGR